VERHVVEHGVDAAFVERGDQAIPHAGVRHE
jgi:hypothetical protein